VTLSYFQVVPVEPFSREVTSLVLSYFHSIGIYMEELEMGVISIIYFQLTTINCCHWIQLTRAFFLAYGYG